MSREFAGTDLKEIREWLNEEGFTQMEQDNGELGFDVWRPFNDRPSYDCVHAAVWPIKNGTGYWVEEY